MSLLKTEAEALEKAVVYAAKVAMNSCEDTHTLGVLEFGRQGPTFRCGKCRTCRAKSVIEGLVEFEKGGGEG